MMPTVYLETTIPSYVTAFPSRDLIVAAHQHISQVWWRNAAKRFDLYISETVLQEIRNGDPNAVERRLNILHEIPILELNHEVRFLAEKYDKLLGLQGKARADIPHFAFATAYEMDYLVTWNCAHIANGEIIRKLIAINVELRKTTPLIVTPEELLDPYEEYNHEQ